MLRETIEFKDFNDQDRKEVIYFHLSESEVVDIVAATPEGIDKELDDALKANDAKVILDFIKRFVHMSYGIKSADGLRFDKSPEILAQFIASPYYSDFLLGLIMEDGKKGQEFMRGILPPKLIERAEQKVRGQETAPLDSHTYAPSARETFDRAQQNRPSVSDHLAPKSSPGRLTRDEPAVQGSNVSAPQPTEAPVDPEFEAFKAWKAQQGVVTADPTTDESIGRVLSDPPHQQRS